jgi:hypothetical protein
LKALNRTSAAADSPITIATIGVIKPTNRQLAIMRIAVTISQPGRLSLAVVM